MYTNQTLQHDKSLAPDRVVLFDVLMPLHPEDAVKAPDVPKDTILQTIITYAYRIILATAYAIRRFVSSTLAQLVFGLGFSLLWALGLSPTKSIDKETLKSCMQHGVNQLSKIFQEMIIQVFLSIDSLISKTFSI